MSVPFGVLGRLHRLSAAGARRVHGPPLSTAPPAELSRLLRHAGCRGAGGWLCPWLSPGSQQTSERAGPRFAALSHDNAVLAEVTRPLKNALEAGRQSSHTTARPVSQSSTGTIRPSTVAPTTEWITEYTWPPTAK
jgi:hypothetical protein